MRNRVSSYFSRKAGAIFLAGVMAGPAAGLADGQQPVETVKGDALNISELVPTGKVCVSLGAVKDPKTPVERYLTQQYEQLQQTPTGRQMFDASEPDPVQVCYDRVLDETDSCGYFSIGRYYEVLSLNPAESVSDRERTSSAMHEIRHRFQRALGIRYGIEGNVPERERVVMNWLIEADARITSILFAFEQAEKGNKSYLDAMRGDKKMVEAFYKKLNPERTNVSEAAHASMLAFLQQKGLMMNYANATLGWISDNHMEFHPKAPVTPLLVTGTLLEMGKIGYGNYMSQEIVDSFSKAFSQKDFKELKAARAKKSKGPVCG